MNAKRTAAAVATLAGLAVGLAACSPDGTPAEPGTPVPTVTETTVASEPAATVTETAIDDPDTTEPTETETSERRARSGSGRRNASEASSSSTR